MKLSRLLLCSMVLLALWGCGTPGRSTGRAPQGAEFKTGLPIEPGHAQQIDYATRWVTDIALEGDQEITAVRQQGDMLLIVEQPINLVTALRVDDGALMWKRVIGSDLEDIYTPVADEERVYVNTNNRLFALDRRRGNVLDVQDLDYPVNAGPNLTGSLAIFGSVSGEVFAHDVTNGFSKWAYRLPASIATPPIQSGINTFAADVRGNYAMLATNNGQLLWRGHVYGPITVPPAIDRAFIIVASQDQSLYSLAANTGRFRWPPYRSEAPFVDPPIVIDDSIYIAEPRKGLTALDADTGQPRWTIPELRTPLLLDDGALLVYTEQTLGSLDPATGRVLFHAPTRPLNRIVIGPGRSLILAAKDGRLHRIDPQ